MVGASVLSVTGIFTSVSLKTRNLLQSPCRFDFHQDHTQIPSTGTNPIDEHINPFMIPLVAARFIRSGERSHAKTNKGISTSNSAPPTIQASNRMPLVRFNCLTCFNAAICPQPHFGQTDSLGSEQSKVTCSLQRRQRVELNSTSCNFFIGNIFVSLNRDN